MTSPVKNVVSSESRVLHYTARVLTVVVAAAAAILSFDALTELAVAAGISEYLAWIWAIVVDGFILIATISVFALRKRGKLALAWPFFILGLFVLISIIGNGLHPILRGDELQLSGTPDFGGNGTLPFWAATVVTAVPPVALFLAIHLLTVMVTPSKTQEKAIAREEKAAIQSQRKMTPAFIVNTAESAVQEVVFTPEVASAPDIKMVTDAEESFTPVIEMKIAPLVAQQFGDRLRPTFSEKEQEVAGKLIAGVPVSGKEAAELFGVSLRAGQNKLKRIREELELV